MVFKDKNNGMLFWATELTVLMVSEWAEDCRCCAADVGAEICFYFILYIFFYLREREYDNDSFKLDTL